MNECGYLRRISSSSSARGPGKTLPTKATSYCLATSCLRWISGSQASGSQAAEAIPAGGAARPRRAGRRRPGRSRGPSRRHQSKLRWVSMAHQARRTQLGRQVIPQPVVDIEIEVKPRAGDSLELVGPEMLDLDQSAQGAAAVDAGRLGPLASSKITATRRMAMGRRPVRRGRALPTDVHRPRVARVRVDTPMFHGVRPHRNVIGRPRVSCGLLTSVGELRVTRRELADSSTLHAYVDAAQAAVASIARSRSPR